MEFANVRNMKQNSITVSVFVVLLTFLYILLDPFSRSLSSDLRRLIGHATCLESTALNHVQDFLSQEPLARMLSGGDTSKIPLYRWRHIRGA